MPEESDFGETNSISIRWHIRDVALLRPDLTDEQAMLVLKQVQYKADCSVGVSWYDVCYWAHRLYPLPGSNEQIEPHQINPRQHDAHCEVLLRRMKADGLGFASCRKVWGQPIAENRYVQSAFEQYDSDDIVIDYYAYVTESQGGAYVAARVWVEEPKSGETFDAWRKMYPPTENEDEKPITAWERKYGIDG